MKEREGEGKTISAGVVVILRGKASLFQVLLIMNEAAIYNHMLVSVWT